MNRRAQPGRTCAATGCSHQTKPGHLMCRDHWFSTPRPLRLAIKEGWARRREDGLRSYSANVLEARKFHFQNSPAASAARITGEKL